jgi:hypothetical protein
LVVIASSLTIASIVVLFIVTLVLTRLCPSFAMPLPPTPSVVKVRMPQWTTQDYVVRDLSAHWLRTEGKDADAYDVYEVKGALLKKSPQASNVARVTVTLRLAGFSAGFTSQTVFNLSEAESKAFAIRVDEGTLARMRGSDVEFFVTVEPVN